MKPQQPITRLSLAFLLLVPSGAFFSAASKANDLLLEGKCTIPEIASTHTQCTIINDRRSITVLTGRSQNFLVKLLISDLLISGRLTADFEKSSPRLRSVLPRSLSEIGTGLGDAQNSTNVRAVQFNRDGAINTLIFIANRNQKNIAEINSLIPTRVFDIQAGSDLAPAEARNIINTFQREFERCQSLYDSLMFEEGDRVLDMAIAKSRLFKEQYGNREGAAAVSNALAAQIQQLQRLRDYKSYERLIEEQQAEENYTTTQRRIAEKERQRREHQYRMAVEYRRSLEAIASRWYRYWGIHSTTNIFIVR